MQQRSEKLQAAVKEVFDHESGMLKRLYPKGGTVYTILRHVSRSGMQREISLVAFKEGVSIHPNYAASVVIGKRLKRGGMHDALVVSGCGFDAGYDIVDALSLALYGKSGELHHEWL